MRMRPRHPVAVLLLALNVAACARWELSTVSPRQLLESESRPTSVRVVQSDGTRTVVREPRIANDSIATTTGGCRRLSGLGERYLCPTTGLVALDDVRVLETRTLAPIRPGVVLPPLTLLITVAVLFVQGRM